MIKSEKYYRTIDLYRGNAPDLLNRTAEIDMERMSIWTKLFLLLTVACGTLAACAPLMPMGSGFGAGRSGGQMPEGGPPPNPNPERLIYRIDDHRFITIRADETCAGGIVYHDTRLGIRTGVAATGFSLGYGVAKGRYAIDSPYIAIPALGWSTSQGGILLIYYSSDQGRTFYKLRVGAEPDERAKIFVAGNDLYVSYNDSEVFKFDISHEIALDDFGFALGSWGHLIHPESAPKNVQSPSGMDRMSCGEPIIAQ